MAQMNFSIIGKLNESKETDKFKPYRENVSDNGWKNVTYMFNVLSDSNRHSMQIQGGSYLDGHGNFYATEKTEDGKYKQIEIPFAERLNKFWVDRVVDFGKYIVDLNDSIAAGTNQDGSVRHQNMRRFVANLLDAKRPIEDWEYDVLGVEHSLSALRKLDEECKRKYFEYINPLDFLSKVREIANSPTYSNKKFLVMGNRTCFYSDEKQRWYNSYVPTRLYISHADSEETSTGSMKVFFDSNAVSDRREENGKVYIKCYTSEYNRNRKKDIFHEDNVVVCADDAPSRVTDKNRWVDGIIKKFTVDEEDVVKEYGVTVNILDGAVRKEVTFDDLTEDQKSDIEFGITTLEEIRRESGTVFGDRVTEYRFVSPSRGYAGTGVKDTVYKSSDFEIKPFVDTSEKVSLFEDDDDI